MQHSIGTEFHFLSAMKIILWTVVLITFTNAQQTGMSTRYWDCCKPSCAWSDKAPVSKPVESCAADGYFGLPDHLQSGCVGTNGTAYSCNSNQPWAVNDNLSYGFASIFIVGQVESDWCCNCYELTFTTEPLIGKRMIVQANNIAVFELEYNHFDLQIPGGGVGNYNGCTQQWNAPPDGWGNRYGGVTSIEGCDELPPQLQNGCRWRFQWFKDVNNPYFTFVPVACPLEIVLKSGCSRN